MFLIETISPMVLNGKKQRDTRQPFTTLALGPAPIFQFGDASFVVVAPERMHNTAGFAPNAPAQAVQDCFGQAQFRQQHHRPACRTLARRPRPQIVRFCRSGETPKGAARGAVLTPKPLKPAANSTAGEPMNRPPVALLLRRAWGPCAF